MEYKLISLVQNFQMNQDLKITFINRINEGKVSRDENPASHMCVYFAAFDKRAKQVFIGKHIKSGLWLFNGGHLDKNEGIEHALYREMNEEWGFKKKIDANSPSLFTITEIENPKKQTCRLHFDIWYFVLCDKNDFHPDTKKLSTEFFEWGWKSISEAQALVHDKATLAGIEKLSSLFLIY